MSDGRKQGHGTVDQSAEATLVEVASTSLHARVLQPEVEG